MVIHIWEELFGIPHLSLNDNFFELGGNSLQAIQLMSLVRDKFGIELESMFDDPTVCWSHQASGQYIGIGNRGTNCMKTIYS